MTRRRFGPRRPGTRFDAAYVLAATAWLPVFLLPAYTTVSWADALKGAFLLSTAGSWANWLRRRSRLPTADDVTQADPRPHVLFLRTFGKEWLVFSWKELPEGLNRAQKINTRLEDDHDSLQTLEMFLGPELGRRVGPFIALGDPTDRVPREGAARNWVIDSTWEQEFLRLLPRARCIVVQVHVSDGLAWELNHVRAAGLQHKLFMFTPPYPLGKGGSRMVRLNNRLNRSRPERWEKLVPFMKDLGYTLPSAHPGPGSVIAFRDDGRAVVLVTGATTADGYVTPLLTALRA